ncbi:hypothetical protein SpCBS45565_g00459 [Spizellomyces sp. 'palustris']|nr:hypothetical protein SpCBS45565_g00459 [Spizellomyces sp. 'palustris']
MPLRLLQHLTVLHEVIAIGPVPRGAAADPCHLEVDVDRLLHAVDVLTHNTMTLAGLRPMMVVATNLLTSAVTVATIEGTKAEADILLEAVMEATVDVMKKAMEAAMAAEAVATGAVARPPGDAMKGNDEQRQTTSCLYVGNLPYSFREEDVQDLFDRYGRLRSVSVPFDRFTGRNKGFAFVAYEDRRDAEDAKNKYDGFLVEGRRLKIDWDIGLDKKDEIKSTTRPARGAPGDDFGRDRPRSPPPAPAGELNTVSFHFGGPLIIVFI